MKKKQQRDSNKTSIFNKTNKSSNPLERLRANETVNTFAFFLNFIFTRKTTKKSDQL